MIEILISGIEIYRQSQNGGHSVRSNDTYAPYCIYVLNTDRTDVLPARIRRQCVNAALGSFSVCIYYCQNIQNKIE